LYSFAKVYCLEWDTQMLSDDHGIVAIVKPWTFFADGHRIVMPVLHEHSDYLSSLVPLSKYAATLESTPPESPTDHALAFPYFRGFWLICKRSYQGEIIVIRLKIKQPETN
jgi:hypothetical protein